MKLAQQYGTLLLAMAILLNTLALPLIYIEFKLNQDYIANVFCINRDKPITTCRGQCFLNRQLKEQQKKEQAPERQTTKKLTYETFCQALFDFKGFSFPEKPVHFTAYKSVFISPYLSSIFHPPQRQRTYLI